MRLCLNVILSLALWLAVCVLSASAEVLKVDFGATGQQVMSEFEGFTKVKTDSYTTVTEWFDFSMSTEDNGRVDVTISTNVDKLLGFRNRGTNSTTMGDLIQDHVKAGEGTSGGDKLYLTLGHLKEGQYTITTYHHENLSTAMCDIDILLDDKYGTGQKFTDVPQTNGSSTVGTSRTYDFFANGTDPIKITFAEQAGGLQEACLNGFELTSSVPEPKTIILLVSGIACLAACGRWRRKRLGS